MIAWIAGLPVWELIRISGLVCYAFLFLGIALGIGYGFPKNGKVKARLFKLHTLFTYGGTLIALLHSIFPVVSSFMPFSWKEVLIPFAAHDHRILNGIGTLAGYGLLLLLLSTDLRNRLGRKLWYMTHLLSYPIFIVVWIHGYFIGTDTGLSAVRWMYLLTVLALVVLTVARFRVAAGKRKGNGSGKITVTRVRLHQG